MKYLKRMANNQPTYSQAIARLEEIVQAIDSLKDLLIQNPKETSFAFRLALQAIDAASPAACPIAMLGGITRIAPCA